MSSQPRAVSPTATRSKTGPRDQDLDDLTRLKRLQGLKVSVCLPALDEGLTIGSICQSIRSTLIERGIVDELLVVDSGSADETAHIAREEGATVHRVGDILPEIPIEGGGGKGESLWRSLAVASGDIVVWIDSDIRNFTVKFVLGLLGPLLENDAIVMTKAFYERPLETSPGRFEGGGARVTELAARPLLNLLRPDLAGFVQPLAGEYAVRRGAALELPFLTGYAVDLALLIDVVDRFGIDAVEQVDLGLRIHRNRDLDALGRAAFQVMQGLLLRMEATGRIKLAEPLGDVLAQFEQAEPVAHRLGVVERPPMASVVAPR